MHPGDWAEFADGLDMKLGAVADVLVETVLGELLVQFMHLPVPPHLRKNGGGGDRDAALVGSRNAKPGKRKGLVGDASVKDNAVKLRKLLQRILEEPQVQFVQIA